MDAYRESNRRLWDEWTSIHERSIFYDLEAFKAGVTLDKAVHAGPGIRVRPYEVEEVGDVSGKDLLHLQCHFGIDTLSWARLGARVVGVDFSEAAISLARSISEDLQLDARFVLSTIEDLPAVLDERFDIVYTSRGAIWWLSDLGRWAEVIAHFLRPGGVFYITEFHPVMQTLDDDPSELRVRYPYFEAKEPLTFPVVGSYADRDANVETDVEHGWQHSLGEIVTALAGAGLRIELLNELDRVCHQHFPLLEQGADGWWHLPSSVEGQLPLMFSLRARKP
jgi:SAM-dependent methyltransferase